MSATLADEDHVSIEAIVEGSRRRQMGKHIVHHMWEEGHKHREQEARSLIDTIGQTTMEQVADKA